MVNPPKALPLSPRSCRHPRLGGLRRLLAQRSPESNCLPHLGGEVRGGSSRRNRRGSLLGRLLMILVILGAAGGGSWVYLSGKFKAQAKLPADLITETVKRGPLEIAVVERGNLESAANVTLTSKVEGSATIIKIVEEGTAVTEGTILVELDSSKFKNDMIQQQIAMEQAIAAQKQAVEALAITMAQNTSDIEAAKLKKQLAELDLRKYEEGDSIQETATVEGEVALKREELTRTSEKFAFTTRLSKKGYATQSELEADRIAKTKAEIDLGVALEKQRVLKDFTYTRNITEKRANAEEFGREQERVERKSAAAETQARADLKARELTAQLQTDKYKQLLEQIEFCTVRAPQDGLVVYANERNSRGQSEVSIAEGATVRERQSIIHLPDVSKMRVSAKIHESKIDLIRERLPAKIKVDARPGVVFTGEVDMVSLVPLSGNWPNFNLKEYQCNIAIKDSPDVTSSLKPGLTAEVEILVERILDAIQVPVQAVIERGGRHFAFVVLDNTIERREIKVGRTNDIAIEVKDGLAENERVALNPRAALRGEMERLETDVPEEEASKDGAFKGITVPVDTGDRGSQNAEKPGRPARGAGPAGGPAGGGPGAPSAGPGGAPGGRGAGGPPNLAAMVGRMDKNGDGKLQVDEVPEGAFRDRMLAADKNGDQVIDDSELAAMPRPGGGAPRGGDAPATGGGG